MNELNYPIQTLLYLFLLKNRLRLAFRNESLQHLLLFFSLSPYYNCMAFVLLNNKHFKKKTKIRNYNYNDTNPK